MPKVILDTYGLGREIGVKIERPENYCEAVLEATDKPEVAGVPGDMRRVVPNIVGVKREMEKE